MPWQHNGVQMAPRGGLKVAALRSIWRFMFMKRASICLYIWGLDSSIAYQIKEMFDTHFQFWFCKHFLPEKETSSCFCALARACLDSEYLKNDAWRINTIMTRWNFSANATPREQLIPEVLTNCFQVKKKVPWLWAELQSSANPGRPEWINNTTNYPSTLVFIRESVFWF